MSEQFLIWSNEHDCWWRADGKGYTIQRQDAGRYTKEEAGAICQIRQTSSGKPGEVAVPCEPIDYAFEWAEVGPELLAALEDAQKALDGGFGPAGVKVTVRKAIAKAKEIGDE